MAVLQPLSLVVHPAVSAVHREVRREVSEVRPVAPQVVSEVNPEALEEVHRAVLQADLVVHLVVLEEADRTKTDFSTRKFEFCPRKRYIVRTEIDFI